MDPPTPPVAEIQTAFEAGDKARWTILSIAFSGALYALDPFLSAAHRPAHEWSALLAGGVFVVCLVLLWRRESIRWAWTLLFFCIAHFLALFAFARAPAYGENKWLLVAFFLPFLAVYVIRLMNRARQLEKREARSMRAVR